MKLNYEFPVEVKEDSKWKYTHYARPNRGLHDYERTIVFERKLAEWEQKRLEEMIKLLDNPGYCHWSFHTTDGVKFRLTTTMDSSD